MVPDGFFYALHNLKCPSDPSYSPSPVASLVYEHILSLCRQGSTIPTVNFSQTLALLKSLSATVLDVDSISPLHYLNAGVAGVLHFQALLNILITDVELSTAEQFNAAWAVVLYKGGSKPKHLAKSWRCISSCPLVAKALDLHVFTLMKPQWDAASASTQFMKDGSSHELCALALTEVIVYSTKNLKKPVFQVYLDKEAAFDSAHKEHIIRRVFQAAGECPSQLVLYLANRLSSRSTYLSVQGVVLGPIFDDRGVEQGGIPSSRLFQLVTDTELDVLNNMGLGVKIGGISLAALGLADDEVLLAQSIEDAQTLINAALSLSAHVNLRNVPTKTKIVVTIPRAAVLSCGVDEQTAWEVDGVSVPLSQEATHLGIVRGSCAVSNMPAVQARIAAHSRALYSVIGLGMAKNHRSPPSTSLKIEALFSSPVLYSGLAPLLLTKQELSTLNVYGRKVLRQLTRLHKGTFSAALYLLSGVPPAEATIHIRQFGLLSMISHLPEDNPLRLIAVQSLTQNPKYSWFTSLRATSRRYSLPDPLHILLVPPNKVAFKSMVKKYVCDYWTIKFCQEAALLPSLSNFRPASLSLGRGPHPIWVSCPTPHAVRVSIVQVKMLVGTYRSCYHARRWQRTSGACRLPGCGAFPGDVAHMFTSCPFLAPFPPVPT